MEKQEAKSMFRLIFSGAAIFEEEKRGGKFPCVDLQPPSNNFKTALPLGYLPLLLLMLFPLPTHPRNEQVAILNEHQLNCVQQHTTAQSNAFLSSLVLPIHYFYSGVIFGFIIIVAKGTNQRSYKDEIGVDKKKKTILCCDTPFSSPLIRKQNHLDILIRKIEERKDHGRFCCC